MQAIARAARVTIAMVTRSLNDRQAELRYTPNWFACGLVTCRSGMICFIVSDVQRLPGPLVRTGSP